MSASSSTEIRGTETVEQLIGECFVKTAQAILSSRIHEPAAGSKGRNAKRSVWFKLHLQELESARKPLDRWRVERGVGLPLVIEIYLQPSGTISTNISSEDSPGTLIERWCLRYSPSVTGLSLPLSPGGLSRSQMTRLSPLHVYKRLTLLIRSVYSYCRVLPAYKLYRTTSAYRTAPFFLKYKLHSTLPQGGDAVSAVMQRFEFTPVETADAKLHVSVEYQPASTVKVLGQTAVRLPRSPIIKDYVRETESLEEKKNKYLLERGTSQGINSTVAVTAAAAAAAAAVGGGTLLEGAPSAPGAALSGGSTPRRGWSSSFRQSPARIYEPPVYGHQQYPSPTPAAYGASGEGSGAVTTTFPKSTSSGKADTTTAGVAGHLPVPSYQQEQCHEPQQQQGALSLNEGGITSPHNADDDEGDDDFLEKKHSEEGSRVSSSPVAIPGSSPVHSRKRNHGFRSSGNLGALERRGGGGEGGVKEKREPPGVAIGHQAPQVEYAPEKPMSAPALSYLHHLSPAPAVAPSSNIIAADTEEQDKAEKRSSSIDKNVMASSEVANVATPSAVGDEHRRPLPPLPYKLDLPNYLDNTNNSSTSSSCCPVPSSPDLPFAFTPTAQYSCSPASVASSSGGGSGGRGRLLQSLSRPSPPSPSSGSQNNLSGREIPAGVALMRRASWGARSTRDTTTTTVGAPLSQGVTNAVGYSISPIRDTMLESVVLSASNTRNLLYSNKIGSDVVLTSSKTAATGGVGGGAGASSKKDPLLLTFSSAPGERINPRGSTEGQVAATAAAGGRLPREDSEQLPFDFAAETSEEHSHSSNNTSSNDSRGDIQGNNQRQGQGIERSTVENTKVAVAAAAPKTDIEIPPLFDVQSSAASIGAFVRFINEAQPLSGLAPIPLDVGMHQLEAFKNKLSSVQPTQR